MGGGIPYAGKAAFHWRGLFAVLQNRALSLPPDEPRAELAKSGIWFASNAVIVGVETTSIARLAAAYWRSSRRSRIVAPAPIDCTLRPCARWVHSFAIALI